MLTLHGYTAAAQAVTAYCIFTQRFSDRWLESVRWPAAE